MEYLIWVTATFEYIFEQMIQQTLPRIFIQAKELGQSISSIADKLAREHFMGNAMEHSDVASGSSSILFVSRIVFGR